MRDTIDTDLSGLDFTPGWLTRLRTWRAHARLHQVIRSDLLRNGEVGESMDCAHCHRRWFLRRTQFASYLREARR
jgi:hypothetical protein